MTGPVPISHALKVFWLKELTSATSQYANGNGGSGARLRRAILLARKCGAISDQEAAAMSRGLRLMVD